MPQVFNPEFLLDLPVEVTQRLYLEAAVEHDNPFINRLGLWRTEFGKTKMRMSHLRVNRNNLRPRSNCETWNPTVRYGLTPDSIQVTDYELNGEQCPDEFDAQCLREMRAPLGAGAPTFGGTPELDALRGAMVRILARSLSSDIAKVASFSDSDIRAKVKSGLYASTPYADDPKQAEALYLMLEQQDGIWTEIEARTQSSNPDAKIAYVDSNDGTQAGNATRPENVTDFFDSMIAAATPQLQGWFDQTNPVFGMPVFIVQNGIFQAYKKYLRSQNLESAYKLSMEGEIVRDVLEHDGYLVFNERNWDMYDAELGRVGLDGKSKVQRALFTVPGNLTLLANMNSLESQPGTGLILQQSPLIKDKGKTWIYASYGLGVGVAQPDLMVAAYNSSTTFA